jgi:hypothetical protein
MQCLDAQTVCAKRRYSGGPRWTGQHMCFGGSIGTDLVDVRWQWFVPIDLSPQRYARATPPAPGTTKAVNYKPRQSPSTRKKSSPSFALPAPSRGVLRRSLPLRSIVESLCAGLQTEDSHGLLVTARLQACLRSTSSPVRRVTPETCSLSAFVAVMFTRRLLDDERRGAVMQSRLCARPTNTRLYEPIF